MRVLHIRPMFEPRDLWVGLYVGKEVQEGPFVYREFFFVFLTLGIIVQIGDKH